MKKILTAILLLMFFSLTFGRQAVYAKSVSVPADTEIWARLNHEYTSENVHSGNPISATLEYDIIFDNVVVFKKGSDVKIIIDEARKKRFCRQRWLYCNQKSHCNRHKRTGTHF